MSGTSNVIKADNGLIIEKHGEKPGQLPERLDAVIETGYTVPEVMQILTGFTTELEKLGGNAADYLVAGLLVHKTAFEIVFLAKGV